MSTSMQGDEQPKPRSPLESEIRRLIRIAGPMPVSQYMTLCLAHPEHGYYMTREPFGTAGDFTTAPEISQMFGELVGLWAAAVWQSMGEPSSINLVELGPGRGTMMADILRAAKLLPPFYNAIVVHLVEASPKLQAQQREKFAGGDKFIVWHRRLNDMPTAPGIFLANEYFDALPIRQAVRQADGWHERTVEIGENDELQFGLDPLPLGAFEETLPPAVRQAPIGSIFEWRSPREGMELGRRVARRGAGLVIDYGHTRSAVGETLQAVRSHRYAGILDAPGLADLSAHVDFEALETAIGGMGPRTEKITDQGSFLHRLGIEARAETLKAGANARTRAEIDSAVARLTSMGETGMGRMFKVLGFADRSFPPLPGFDG